jgi:hypothetical protein
MDDEFLPDEYVLDDVPEEPEAPRVIFAGPSDAPPVFRISPSAAQKERRRPSYAVLAFCLGSGALVVAVIEAQHPRPVPVERTAVSVTKIEPPAAPAPAASASDGKADAEATEAEAAQDAKRIAQSELEKGHSKAAIAAGERSVALDPTDAEAWLILGAGYDQRAAYADARRCFKECVRTATHGPRGECAALLR